MARDGSKARFAEDANEQQPILYHVQRRTQFRERRRTRAAKNSHLYNAIAASGVAGD